MNRYLLFTYDIFYPCGGANDLKKTFKTIEEAYEYIKSNFEEIFDFSNVEILDVKDLSVSVLSKTDILNVNLEK